jgi:hypothetical protein
MRSTIGARTARRYAEQFSWSIARGHFASEKQSAMHCCCGAELPLECIACSCGAQRCASPGCHPVSEDWAGEASNDAEAITQLWHGERWWPIALTGIEFDVVVVVGPLPLSALANAGDRDAPLGLTLTWRDEWHAFFTAPGALESRAAQQRVGVSVRGAGAWIPLPAVALHSPARWVESPMDGHGLVLNSVETVMAMLPTDNPRDGSEAEAA